MKVIRSAPVNVRQSRHGKTTQGYVNIPKALRECVPDGTYVLEVRDDGLFLRPVPNGNVSSQQGTTVPAWVASMKKETR